MDQLQPEIRKHTWSLQPIFVFPIEGEIVSICFRPLTLLYARHAKLFFDP